MKDKSNNSIGTLSTEERLQNAINKLSLQNEVMNKRAQELILANKLSLFESNEKAARADELIIANKELAFQNKEKEKRADDLVIANKELKKIIAERKKALDALNTLNETLEQRVKEKTETVFKTLQEKNIILESFGDAFFALDSNWTVTYWNRVAEQNLGINRNDIIGKNLWEVFPGSEDTISYRNHHHVMETKQPMHFEDYYPVLNIWHEINSYPAENGLSIFFKDITERKIVEEKLIKSNRLHAFTSAINQMIVKTTDETALYNEACRIAVTIGKFKMAWIGRIDEATKKVIPLVHAGEADGYFTKMIPISIEDIPEGKGPIGTALREGRYMVCNDIENDPQMVPWKETAVERGYLSCMAFPLIKFGKVVGTYSLYAPVKNFFDEAEIALLEEAAGDISFALDNFEIAARHKVAEDKIIESEDVFRRLFNESADATLLLDDTGFIRCNTSAVTILGYATKEEVIGKQPWDISPEKQPDEKLSKVKAKAMIAKALKDGYKRFEWLHVKADATELHVEVMLTPIVLRGSQSFYTVWRDITERKRIENEIRDYKFALDESSLVDISDGNGKISYVNENFCRLSKYSREELIGQDHRILNSGYHPTELFQNLWTTVQAGKIWRNEVRNRAKDGSFFWGDTTIVPFLDNDGKPFQFITIRTDITERKKAEEKLKENYALLNIAGDIAKLGGWCVNLEENRSYWSDEVAAILEMPAGYAPLVEEVINFYAPEWRDKITEVFTNCVKKGISYDEDMEILTASKKRIWVKTKGEAVRDTNGRIVKVQGAFQDITERKHTEKALQLTQFAFDHASDAIFWITSDARIVNVNEAACVSLGYTQQELLSLSVPDIDPDFNVEAWSAFFPELRKKHSIPIETNHLRKDGSTLPVEIRSNYIQFGDKEFSCAFVRDTSERKKVEQNLERQNRELQKTNTELDRFVYSTSHDLRAPLASLLGLIDITTDEVEPNNELLIEYLGMMKESALKLDNFIGDILTYSRNARTEFENEDIVFDDMIQEVLEKHKFLEMASGFELKIDVNQKAAFISDKRRISTILNNLIYNAIKYKDDTKEKSFVHISVQSNKKNATIIIEDNGIGVAEKDKKKIFEMFYRASTQSTGSGLGLYIVQETIDKLGATMTLESEKSVGSKFTITIFNLLDDENENNITN